MRLGLVVSFRRGFLGKLGFKGIDIAGPGRPKNIIYCIARLESLSCTADFSAAHFKFQPRFQSRNFRKTKGNNRTIV